MNADSLRVYGLKAIKADQVLSSEEEDLAVHCLRVLVREGLVYRSTTKWKLTAEGCRLLDEVAG